VGEFFAHEVAEPFSLPLYIGLPPELDVQLAPTIRPSQRQALAALANPVWLRYALLGRAAIRGLPRHLWRHRG
jgi:hypothetical protein